MGAFYQHSLVDYSIGRHQALEFFKPFEGDNQFVTRECLFCLPSGPPYRTQIAVQPVKDLPDHLEPVRGNVAPLEHGVPFVLARSPE